MKSFLLSLALSSALAVSAANTVLLKSSRCRLDDQGYYVAKSGDTVPIIAKRCNIEVGALMDANPYMISEDYPLIAGDQLYVPPSARSNSGCTQFEAQSKKCTACQKDYELVKGKCQKLQYPSGCASINVNDGSCLTCKPGFAFDKDRKCMEKALPSGCTAMDTNGTCTACSEKYNLIDGACNQKINQIENCKTSSIKPDGSTTVCDECQPGFMKNKDGKCVQGCADGKFLIYDVNGYRPVECSDGQSGQVYKIKVNRPGDEKTFLGAKANWHSMSKESNYNDGWKFQIGPNRILQLDNGKAMSVSKGGYKDGSKDERERIKDWDSYSNSIFLHSGDNGNTVQFVKKGRKPEEDCAANGPEEIIQYVYGCGEGNSRLTFQLFKA